MCCCIKWSWSSWLRSVAEKQFKQINFLNMNYLPVHLCKQWNGWLCFFSLQLTEIYLEFLMSDKRMSDLAECLFVWLTILEGNFVWFPSFLTSDWKYKMLTTQCKKDVKNVFVAGLFWAMQVYFYSTFCINRHFKVLCIKQ